MRKITVRIHKGSVEVQPEGYKGEVCKDATKLLEKVLGTVQSDTPTQELYESPQQEHISEGT